LLGVPAGTGRDERSPQEAAMSHTTFVRILESLALALVTAGVLFGFAQAWGHEAGIAALWTAAAVAFVSTAIARFAAGTLHDRRETPMPSRHASVIAMRVAGTLAVLLGLLVLVVGHGPRLQFALWWVLLYVPQLLLQLLWVARERPSDGAPTAR
jgi:hypothetical protein